MNPYIWRTAAGSNKFVCSYTGSDWYGNGTQAKPYKSLTKRTIQGRQRRQSFAVVFLTIIWLERTIQQSMAIISGLLFGTGRGPTTYTAFYLITT
jgi:hypothetical protein